MRILAVGDVHYDLRQLDWLLAHAAEFEMVILVGDLLDVSSTVPLDAQVPVALRYLERLASRCPTAVCSGNHDLTGNDPDGERSALWLADAEAQGLVVDDGSLTVGDALVSVWPWWDGPIGRARLEAQLTAQADRRAAEGERSGVGTRWIWVYHWPPPDLPVSWVGTKSYGDADLAGWVERFRPDLVLTGHVHESPWLDGGSWIASSGPTTIVNAGRQIGSEPSRIVIDLDEWTATWTSHEETAVHHLGSPEAVAQ
jgi:Icc-related predicted phosphoesterase